MIMSWARIRGNLRGCVVSSFVVRSIKPWLVRVIGTLSESCVRMRAQGLFDLPFALAIAVVLPVLVCTVSFFFGGVVQGWMFWFGIVLALVCATLRSMTNAIAFVAVTAFAFIGAAAVFAYNSWDSAVCHWPMMQALCEGWNPILGATDGQFAATVGTGTCSFPHILCAPKFPAEISALVVKGTGLFSGIGFGFAMLFVICFMTGYRFLRQEVGTSRVVSLMAGLLMAAPLELMRQTLQGYVDYFRYTAILIGLFSYLLWRRSGRLADLLLFLLGFVIAACSKSGALIWTIIAFVMTACIHWRSQLFRRSLLGAVLLLLILGFAPYVTEWVHNGSPFYPAHSFVRGNAVVNLCADLTSPQTRNPAALKMGWLAREVYAWVSVDLAIVGCRWWYSDPDFTPLFKSPFVNGLGSGFSHWLIFCGFAFCFIRNRSVRMVGIFVVSMILFLPTRFVGFYRYTPEIAVLPPMCLAALSRIETATWHLNRILQWLSTTMLAYMCMYFILFTLSWVGLQFGLEAERQREFSSLAEGKTVCIGSPLNQKLKYTCSSRVKAAVLSSVNSSTSEVITLYFAPPETFDLGLIPARNVAESRRRRTEVLREKPIFFSYYNSLFSPFQNFDRWKRYRFGAKDIPGILWRNSL